MESFGVLIICVFTNVILKEVLLLEQNLVSLQLSVVESLPFFRLFKSAVQQQRETFNHCVSGFCILLSKMTF